MMTDIRYGLRIAQRRDYRVNGRCRIAAALQLTTQFVDRVLASREQLDRVRTRNADIVRRTDSC